VLTVVVWLVRRKKAVAAEVADVLAVPAEPTPFTTITFLRRLGSLHLATLSEADQTALATEIARLEAGYFSGAEAPALDLTEINRKWLRTVGG
ncbi:MAG: hypothetical protein K9M97_00820, partial [Akkermansiaceae bacterium]|nr:hypothetical protein [Akkermansiaceae bacterium]